MPPQIFLRTEIRVTGPKDSPTPSIKARQGHGKALLNAHGSVSLAKSPDGKKKEKRG